MHREMPFSFRNLSASELISRLLFILVVLVLLLVSTVCFVKAMSWINKPFAGFLLNERMVVGNVGQYYWTGTHAGLTFPDKILKANGKPIASMKDLDSIIGVLPEDEKITYTIQRHGETFDLIIPTMRFSLVDFLTIFGTYLFSALAYLIIGIIVYVLKPATKVSWAFLMLCFFLSLYNITAFDMVTTHHGFLFVYMLASAFFPAAGIHFSLLFPEESGIVRRAPLVQYLPYLLATVLISAIFLSYPHLRYAKIYGLFVPPFMALSVFALLFSVLRSFFRSASTLARQRAKVMVFGAALAFPVPAIIMILSNLGRSLGNMSILNNFMVFPILFFPASIAYAIAKHNLFDVDVYIKRAVGYGFMTLVVGSGYFLIQTTLDTFVLRPLFGEAAMKVYPVLFAFLVVFLFDPVNRRVQGAVDKLFYRKKADYKETILSVSNDLSTVLDLTEVVKRIIHTVRKDMFIDTAGIFLPELKKNVCRSLFLSEEQDASGGSLSDNLISCDDPLLTVVRKGKTLITKYDIAEDDRYVTVREACGRRFAALGASMVIPIIYQGEVTGAMALGHKKSGHFYTREDIDLLNTLASHGAVAIENARMAERMKEEEVVRTNLSRYLSPQVVDQIIHKDMKVNLGGDKKVVTVLFSDIRNFTTITESLKPDQMVQILNEYFTEMARIIFENQGSLDKYIGDAIVAVFGSLIPIENPAANAAMASIEMMKRMPSLNMRWTSQFNVTINIGIGINTGEVFLGNLGSPERMEFTVIGDTVNVASRFSGIAKAGQILLTREAMTCLGASLPIRELPPTEVKGKTGKMEVFEVVY